MRGTAERPIGACLASFFYRFVVLFVCVVAAGCALVERAGSPTADPGVTLGEHEVVEVSRYRDAARKYHCSGGVLMCDDSGAAERCHCSVTGVVQLR